MAFCTAINCMDGRVQLPVINYLMKRFDIEFVDSITEPGPVKILAEHSEPMLFTSILKRVSISIQKHRSRTIVVCAHADCAGNPVTDSTQQEQLRNAATILRKKYPDMEIISLWIDAHWTIHELFKKTNQ